MPELVMLAPDDLLARNTKGVEAHALDRRLRLLHTRLVRFVLFLDVLFGYNAVPCMHSTRSLGHRRRRTGRRTHGHGRWDRRYETGYDYKSGEYIRGGRRSWAVRKRMRRGGVGERRTRLGDGWTSGEAERLSCFIH